MQKKIMMFIFCLLLIKIYLKQIYKQELFTSVESKKHKLCIMAIFKNEHNYLEEWLVHHISQGISHFYLYCNDEKIENYPFLKKYKKNITFIPWTDVTNNKSNTIQRQAYSHCIKTYSNNYNFIMLLDIDEFITSIIPNKTVIDFIDSLDTDDTKAIKVMRYNYGSNGHLIKPDSNVMDSYKMHERLCSSYKTIANSKYINTLQNFYGVHDFPFLPNMGGKVYNNFFSYGTRGYPNHCKESDKNEIPLIIKHYYTKSYEEYLKRCKMWEHGGVNNVGYRTNCKNKFNKDDKNEVEIY
jgi:hypothetical protein